MMNISNARTELERLRQNGVTPCVFIIEPQRDTAKTDDQTWFVRSTPEDAQLWALLGGAT